MATVDKQKLMNELRRFNQRKVLPGEVVLLSYCLANSLPIFEKDSNNPAMDLIKHHRLIENTVFRLCEFAAIDKETVDLVKQHVLRFLLWRTGVAYGDLRPLFSGDTNTVIDDMSCLARFHDTGTLCTVADVANNANWLVSTFCDLVKYETFVIASEEGN